MLKPFLHGAALALALTVAVALPASAQPMDPAPGAAEPPPPPPKKPKAKPKPTPASFECRDARSEAERVVCRSFELAKLDVQMYRAYLAYTDSLGPDQGLTLQSAELAQRRWVINRDQCGDEFCVRDLYEDRIDTLRAQHNTNMGLRR
jgi:uncharacterized protein YecT (DUF1311 family)